MESRMMRLEAFTVVGKKETLNMLNGEHLVKIPEMWNSANEKEGLIDHLLAINDGSIEGVFGISDVSKTSVENMNFDYWIGVHSSHTADLTHIEIPPANWIAFEVDGTTPQSIQAGFQQIFTTELKTHNLEAVIPYQVEFYPPNYVAETSTIIEIWIPIEVL